MSVLGEGFVLRSPLNTLMTSATSKQQDALAVLFRSEARLILRYLVARSGSRTVAEDLLGQTFLAASRQFASGAGSEVSPPWLRTVAKRRLIDHWRAIGSQRRCFERLVDQRRDVSSPAEDSDGSIRGVLALLPDRQRAALTMRYLDAMSVSEVADGLGSSYSATESLLARARSSFARAYEGSACRNDRKRTPRLNNINHQGEQI